MFGLQGTKPEDKIAKNEKLLKELLLRSQEQEAYFEELYNQYGIPKDKLIDFLADYKNFDEETWQKMERIRAEIAKEIQIKLNQINPLKTKTTYKDLHMAQQWILVR